MKVKLLSVIIHSVIIHSLIHQLNRYKLIECFLSSGYWRYRVIILNLCHQKTCKNFEMVGEKEDGKQSPEWWKMFDQEERSTKVLQTKKKCVHSLGKKDVWSIWNNTTPGNGFWERLKRQGKRMRNLSWHHHSPIEKL